MIKVFYYFIFLIILVFAGFFLFDWLTDSQGGPSLSFTGPEVVSVAIPFELAVGVRNDSSDSFQEVELALTLPEGLVVLDNPEKNLITIKVDDLQSGSLVTKSLKLMAVLTKEETLAADEELIRETGARISYSTPAGNSRYQKKDQAVLRVKKSDVDLSVDLPAEVESGQNLNLAIAYQNGGEIDLNNLSLEVVYPDIFRYQTASLKPDQGNGHWEIGGLRPGSANNFVVSGKLVGVDGGTFPFVVKLLQSVAGREYLIAQAVAETNIRPSSLSLTIAVNEVDDYIARAGDLLRYTISYDYLTGAPAAKAVIQLELSGQMFELGTIQVVPQSGIAFAVKHNVVSWSLASSSGSLPKSGAVAVEVRVRDDFPIKRSGDRNFLLKVKAQLDDGRHTTVAQSETKVAGKIGLAAKAFFRDAAAGVINKGPFPPIVGQATDYTIHWLLTSYATDVSDIVVRGTLPAGVDFAGVKKVEGGGQLSYSQASREVIWKVDRLSATRGVLNNPAEAIFQVTAAPAAGLIGNYMLLFNETAASATDSFTDLSLAATASSLTTRLEADQTVREMEGIVR